MWELDHKERWALKNEHFQILVLEEALDSLLARKEIKLVNSKGNSSWIGIRRIDAEAKVQILWPHDAKSWLWKDPELDMT